MEAQKIPIEDSIYAFQVKILENSSVEYLESLEKILAVRISKAKNSYNKAASFFEQIVCLILNQQTMSNLEEIEEALTFCIKGSSSTDRTFLSIKEQVLLSLFERKDLEDIKKLKQVLSVYKADKKTGEFESIEEQTIALGINCQEIYLEYSLQGCQKELKSRKNILKESV